MKLTEQQIKENAERSERGAHVSAKPTGQEGMVNSRQLATILAALRYWQREGLMSSGHEQDIACDGGVEPLNAEEIDELCEHLNTTFFIEEERPQQEPDEPLVWHHYNLHTRPDGTIGGSTETNDDADRGVPGTVESWRVNYPDRAAAMLHTGGSHIGISGVKVTVTIDGEQV